MTLLLAINIKHNNKHSVKRVSNHFVNTETNGYLIREIGQRIYHIQSLSEKIAQTNSKEESAHILFTSTNIEGIME